ncbi:c-type cytochrome [Sulfurimonas sp.]|uniref:c-type cytochrome n=1 Tax=Sulfurimonas sp. TaxID=2022749 RepID=UPI002B48B798|nr:cytochrome c [Sulfurimonas sp.]
MRYLLLFIVPIFLFGETTFITPLEYASQLYKNPRGIGCHHCHGDKGEGKVIARYIEEGVEKEFSGPAINELNFNIFYNALNKRKNGMPRYFLTKKELQALYLYLQENKGKKNVK